MANMSFNYTLIWLIALVLSCVFSPVLLAGDHDHHHHQHVHTGSTGFIRYLAGQTSGDLHTSDHDDDHHHHHNTHTHTVPVRVVSSPAVCCEPVVDSAPVVSRVVTTHHHHHHDPHPAHLVKSYYTIRRSYTRPLVYSAPLVHYHY